MMYAVKNGKLIPPANGVIGRKRAFMLAAECVRIKEQLNNKGSLVYVVEGETPEEQRERHAKHWEWFTRAKNALTMRNMELRLLTEWLETQGTGLLKRATALFNQLVTEDTDFDPAELQLISELNDFMGRS